MNPAKPKLGEVWQQQRENSSLPTRLYLVIGRTRHEQEDPPCDPPVFHEQHSLLDLELGKTRRVNVRSFHGANGWSRFRYRANNATGLEGAKRTKRK